MKITIGIPAYNEARNIATIITRLKKITDSIIVCDDGSTDMTSDISKNLGAIVVSHKKNMGYGVAINSIFQKSKEMNSDLLVTFDADGQHRVEDIEKVIEPIKNNDADLVIGSRFLAKKSNVPNYRKIGIKVITQITNMSIKKKLTDSQSGFRAYNKRVLSQISPADVGMGISTEILIKSSSKGLRITEVPITILYEGDTSTHDPVSHGTSVLISTIKYTSIEHPLKFYGLPSIFFLITGIMNNWGSRDLFCCASWLGTSALIVLFWCGVVRSEMPTHLDTSVLCEQLFGSVVGIIRSIWQGHG